MLNLYEQEIAVVSYPQLKPLRKFGFPEELALDGETREFMPGSIAPINEKIWSCATTATFATIFLMR